MKSIPNRYVDVFYGSGATAHPQPQGIAATWFYIKAQCGNTYPHAALPFGRMSCGAYTGGYPSGYGNHLPNFSGPVRTFDAKVRGFSHMHQTGTGALGTYYNYAIAAPFYGELRELNETLKDEYGEPGYYRATLAESGINTEITVCEGGAYHRYHFRGNGSVSVDFSNIGLNRDFGTSYYDLAEDAEIRVDGNALTAALTLQGVRTYFYADCLGAVKNTYLWQDYKHLKETLLRCSKTEQRFGGCFEVDGECTLRVFVSSVSTEEARRAAMQSGTFDEVREEAAAKWKKALSRITIDADEPTKGIFYSNLYHSLLKPARWEEEFTDFATLWDMYKTQLPLVFTFYPEESRGIVQTLLRAGEKYGAVPNALLRSNDPMRFENQAKMLATHILTDAYYRNFATADEILTLAQGEISKIAATQWNELLESGRYTHILDIAEACYAAMEIAEENGNAQAAKLFRPIAEKWKDTFADDGLLKDGPHYYEGDRWNYSFRLLPQMDQRIALCGTEQFICLADNFFGYGKEPVAQWSVPNDGKGIRALQLHRFDGLNNEHDMETPYAYLFAGRHDKTCEIIRQIMKYMFAEGPGGLPGNNDSGALSAWYVWNALGLYPLSGQNKMLLGSPIVRHAEVALSSGHNLVINVHGCGMYTEKVLLNGTIVKNMQIPVTTFMEGGTLEFYTGG